MNLYSIDFQHWSQKDSATGIKGYLIADNDEQVLDWLCANDTFNDLKVWTWYKDKIEEKPKKRARLLKKKGELYDQKVVDNLSDFYYGNTLYGWSLVNEQITQLQAESLVSTGVAKFAVELLKADDVA